MGYKYEVHEWTMIDAGDEPKYEYQIRHQGNSLSQALKIMRDLKRKGAGCVKLEWR